MPKSSFQTSRSLLRGLLLPYVFLLVLYLLVIGVGSSWLYLTARHAQTALVTGHIVEVVSPFLKQLSENHQASRDNDTPFILSEKVSQLYQALPHLRQVSIRDQLVGYGVRLTSRQQLVDVELEPLKGERVFISKQQDLAQQLQNESSPLFHINFDMTSAQGSPIQMDVAFDRAGLVGRINGTLQAIIHSIIGFSVIGILSILLALAITLYTGLRTHKMEASLQKIYQQAAMGKLAASLVHDLRNPLASIRANIKNLLITPDETEQVIDEMDHDILRLEQKLTDFLSLTKPRNQGFETIKIEPLVNELVRKCKPLLDEKELSISVLIEDNLPEITVIPGDIKDALLNLMVNAKNHTPEKGYIWLKIQSAQAQLQIIVEDNGAGIAPALLSKIFAPFFTTREEGHGLGLAIVKRTIESHQGSIRAENRSPTGARFIMTIPFTHYE